MPLALAEPRFLLEPDVMDIPARLDSETAPRVEEDVCLCIESGARRMILDCRELSAITGAGLRAILVMARRMREAGGLFAVCDLQPQVWDMFTVTGLNFLIPAFRDRNEAFTAFAS